MEDLKNINMKNESTESVKDLEEFMSLLCSLPEEKKREVKGVMYGMQMTDGSSKKKYVDQSI